MPLRRSAVVVVSLLTVMAGTAVAAGSATAAAVPRCTTASTTVAIGRIHPGANLHTGLLLQLTNVAAGSCVLQGYPRVTLLAPSGAAAQTAERTPSGYLGGAAPTRTVLAPGAQATALLEWAIGPNPDSSPYPATTSLRVSLPGDTHSVTVAQRANADPDLQVHGFVAGTGTA